VQVVAERGYQWTTVAGVCKQAGVSSKTFYVHFEGKEDCFLSAYDLGVELIMASLQQTCAGPAPWAARLHQGLTVLLDTLADSPAFARMSVVEVNAAGPRAIRRLTGVLSRCRAFFDGAGWDGPVPDLTDTILPAVIGGIYTRIYGYVVEGRIRDLPELAPVLTYFALLPFVGREAASEGLAGAPGRVTAPAV
ncbi:MAG: TetR/AcrR family transcriptional regulator, partial [Acidimicrobiales bacterium]